MAYPNEDYLFGLRKCIIAPWLSPGNWGASQQLESCEMYSPTLVTVKDELHGDDFVTALAASVISGTLQVQFGFKSLSIWQQLMNQTITDANTYKTAVQGITMMPYFGISGQVYTQSSIYPYDFFIPKCKITGNVAFTPTWGKIMTQKLDAQFIYDTLQWGYMTMLAHSASGTFTIPPTEN